MGTFRSWLLYVLIRLWIEASLSVLAALRIHRWLLTTQSMLLLLMIEVRGRRSREGRLTNGCGITWSCLSAGLIDNKRHARRWIC